MWPRETLATLQLTTELPRINRQHGQARINVEESRGQTSTDSTSTWIPCCSVSFGGRTMRCSLDAHPHDRTGAVLRAPGHALQRVSSHSRARRARPHGRSRHLSVRPRGGAAGTPRVPERASAVYERGRDWTIVAQAAARSAGFLLDAA